MPARALTMKVSEQLSPDLNPSSLAPKLRHISSRDAQPTGKYTLRLRLWSWGFLSPLPSFQVFLCNFPISPYYGEPGSQELGLCGFCLFTLMTVHKPMNKSHVWGHLLTKNGPKVQHHHLCLPRESLQMKIKQHHGSLWK